MLNPQPQQVFEIYSKDLDTLEDELKKLIDQKRQLEDQKPKDTKNKKQIAKMNEKISDIKREIFKKKHQYKLAGAELEKDNREYLIAIQSDKNWYKFTHYSACFFVTDIQSRLENPTRFHLYPDTDNYGYSAYGVISLKLDDDLINNLKALDIVETDSNIEGIRRFKLPWKYTEKRFEKVISGVEQNQSKINDILLPKNISPELFKQIEELNTATYYVVKSISENFLKDTIGRTMFSHTTNLLLNYFKITNCEILNSKIQEAMLEDLKVAGYLLKILLDLNVAKYNEAMRVGGLIVKVRNLTKGATNGKN